MPEVIQDLLQREPFAPFRIITTGGDSYDVTHANLVAMGQSWIFYCYPRSDRFVFIPYNQVSSVEKLPAAA